MVLEKQGWNSMQTKELICPGGRHGASQAYGVVHYLDDSLLDDSFPVKTSPKNYFPSLF
jgi:hypothetical protein